MSKGEPIKMSTTHFVFLCQSFISIVNWLRKLFPWDGKGMEVKFEFEKPSIFEKCVFTSWASKNPQMSAQPIMHACPPLPHVIGSSCAFSFTFQQFSSCFPMDGKLFFGDA